MFEELIVIWLVVLIGSIEFLTVFMSLRSEEYRGIPTINILFTMHDKWLIFISSTLLLSLILRIFKVEFANLILTSSVILYAALLTILVSMFAYTELNKMRKEDKYYE